MAQGLQRHLRRHLRRRQQVGLPATASTLLTTGGAGLVGGSIGAALAPLSMLLSAGWRAALVRLCEGRAAWLLGAVLGAATSTRVDGGKALMPYHPDAPRNRPRESVRNTIGRRFGPSCAATLRRGERYRGASSISFAPPPRRRVDARAWRTTNQAMRPRASVVATTGLDNPGISSSLAKRVHAFQRA